MAQTQDKTLFIIKASSESLGAAEDYLKKKGWQITSTVTAQAALPDIIRIKPKCVIVCLDHPNQSVRLLPKLLLQAFKTHTIGYLESTAPSSLALIAGHSYVLYPPVTPTAIERMIAKVERDERRQAIMDTRKKSATMMAATGDDLIAIRGRIEDEALQAEQHLNRLMMTDEANPAAPRKKHGPLPNRVISSFVNPHNGWNEDTLIIRGTRDAINYAAQPQSLKKEELVELKSNTELMCFSSRSKTYQGQFVCAAAKNQEPLTEFLAAFKSELGHLMADAGEVCLLDNPLLLRVQSVSFEDWSRSQAEFVKKFHHHDRECAIAFFSGGPQAPTVRPSVHQNMFSLQLNHLLPDRRLEFDLFLHFPLNNRYIKYGRQGRIFSGVQHTRLNKKGVDFVHLFQKQKTDLDRYLMQAHLDQKITLHKETSTTPMASSF